MANKTLAQLRAAALQLANYQDSDFVVTSELNDRVNEAVSAYYDLVLASRETYFQETLAFTLAGGFTGNTQALPSDLYKIQGLDYNPGTSSQIPVPTLPSFRERFSVGYRCYDWVPGTLTILPPTSSQGNYLLYYTPNPPVLADPLATPTPDAGDAVDGTLNSWFFTNGAFDATYVGATMTVSGCSNAPNNGTHTVLSVTDPTDIITNAPTSSEAFGTSATVVFQPAGTVPELSDRLQSGALWIELFTAIAVLDKADRDSAPLQTRLAQQSARIASALRWKQDEPRQVPLVRRRGPWGWRGGYGDGWS